MTPTIAVSIVNYRTAALTIACLASALIALEGTEGEVIVVDNASGDGSAAHIEAWIAGQRPPVPVRLLRSPRNTGFAGGHNQGMAAAPGAAFYLLLNSDAELRPGFFAAMHAAATARPESGLFAPRLEWEDGTPQTSCFRFHGPISEFIRGAGSGPVTRALRRWEVGLGHDPDPAEIDWASFACILIRRAVVDSIGALDEGYFLYYEDAEYCLRARRAGWAIARVPEARAVHHRGGSAPVKALARARKRLPAYYWYSRARFLTQAHGHAGLLAANAAWLAGRALAQTRRLLGKAVPPATEAEARDIWIGTRAPLAPYSPPETAP